MLQVIFQSLFCDAEWRHTCGMVQKMKKETEYYIEISKEVCDYLERLSYDIETRKSIITRLFDEAKNSSDEPGIPVLPRRAGRGGCFLRNSEKRPGKIPG